MIVASVGSPFEHDVFISYSHGDVDGTGDSPLKRWTQGFARELESEIKFVAANGAAIRVFLDNGPRPSDAIDPMAPLTKDLMASVDASAIFLILMSPHYLRSKWCGDERTWWFAAQEKRGLRTEGRVAVARVVPTKEEWPVALRDSRGEPMIGFLFHEVKPADATVFARPYDWPVPTRDSRGEFRAAVVHMAGIILRELDNFQRELEIWRKRDQETSRLAEAASLTIYLYGREEESVAFETAFQALSAAGHNVIRGLEKPEDDLKLIQATRRTRIKTLSGCDALILVGAGDGAAIDADMVAVGRTDRNSAVALSDKPLPCAVLNFAGDAVATAQRRDNARKMKLSWLDSAADVPAWLAKPPL